MCIFLKIVKPVLLIYISLVTPYNHADALLVFFRFQFPLPLSYLTVSRGEQPYKSFSTYMSDAFELYIYLFAWNLMLSWEHISNSILSHYRTDTLAILSCVENLLWSICSTVQELVKPKESPRDVVYNIHSYCDCLLTVLTISTTPLEILAK